MPKTQRYIASTDVNGGEPHVVAQWSGDTLDEIVVSNLSDEPLTREQFLAGWDIAQELRTVREEC